MKWSKTALKIGFTGIELPEGKVKYKDEKIDALVKKDQPKKISPFYAEFIKEEFVQTDVIIIPKDLVLDLLIPDIEKCEGRIERSEDPSEIRLMHKCIEYLENETPLCDGEFPEDEKKLLKKLAPVSYKPVVLVEGECGENDLIKQALSKAGVMFFYTSGPQEVHAWLVDKGSDIVTCAGEIHTDLARGFIKGDVVSFEDYLNCHNFNAGRKKGLVKVVDRDHIVEENHIIEIRFNV